jgi:hypothetical protein
MRALVLLLVASLTGIAFADDSETLTGTFVWERDDGEISGDLEARFTSTGDETWKVTFHFEWEGESRVWNGTAKGSLEKGKLEGEAVMDKADDPSTFTFKGKFKRGNFKGTHAQISKEGEPHATGTLTLGR